jgi:hypothetical protein
MAISTRWTGCALQQTPVGMDHGEDRRKKAEGINGSMLWITGLLPPPG